MGKTAPIKRKSGAASVHSRAAKRASSPGIDLDRSLKEIKPPTSAQISRPSIVAIHQGAGILKKSGKGRKAILSATARRRQERGLDRAEAVMDKMEKKIERSKGKAKIGQERSKNWEELNKFIKNKARERGVDVEQEIQENDDDTSQIHDVKLENTTLASLPLVAEDAEEVEEIL